jgi:hypothetical protein
VKSAKQASNSLGLKDYDQLAAPSQNNPVEIFQLKDKSLFEHIINKYMHPRKKE